jgi:SAM-dependent methyltransferase
MASDRYLPALRFPALTRLFDPLIGRAVPERRMKAELVEQAAIGSGQRILDLGCGTGTMAIMAKVAHPDAEVVGLDADPEILALAQGKAEVSGAEVRFDRGLSTALPYEDGSVDRVLSTLFFHHLTSAGLERTRDNAAGALRAIFEQAGLAQPAETGRMRTAFGTLALYRARKPEGG